MFENQTSRRKPALYSLALLLLAGAAVRGTSAGDGGDPAGPSGALDGIEDPRRSHVSIPTQSLDVYVRLADTIVIGSVLRRNPAIVPSGRPTTAVELDVSSIIKGSPGSQLSVLVDDEVGNSLLGSERGTSTLTEGREVLLFLQYSPDLCAYGILGMTGGSYPIARDEHGQPSATGLHALAPVSLEKLLDQILWLDAAQAEPSSEER